MFVAASAWMWVRRERRESGPAWTVTGVRAAALVVMFGALAYRTKVAGRATGADEAVLNWLTDHRTVWLTGPAIAVTDAGGAAGILLVVVVVGTVLSRRARSLVPAVVLIGSVVAAVSASTLVKTLVERGRPPLVTQVLAETDYSFPSGHATGAMAGFGMIAVALGYGLPAGRRWALLLAAGVLTVLVAATRLYLGEHWLTDVVGGILLGGTVVVVGSSVYVALMPRVQTTTEHRDRLRRSAGGDGITTESAV